MSASHRNRMMLSALTALAAVLPGDHIHYVAPINALGLRALTWAKTLPPLMALDRITEAWAER